MPPPFTFTTSGRPSVAETHPEDGASDVAVEEPLQITFSTLMDTGSVERELSIEPDITHELRWSGEVLEILPSDALAPGRAYTIRIGAEAADVAGVPLGEPVTIAFRTVAAGLAPVALLSRGRRRRDRAERTDRRGFRPPHRPRLGVGRPRQHQA